MEAPWEIRHTDVAIFREVEEDGVTVEYLNNYKICEAVGHGIGSSITLHFSC